MINSIEQAGGTIVKLKIIEANGIQNPTVFNHPVLNENDLMDYSDITIKDGYDFTDFDIKNCEFSEIEKNNEIGTLHETVIDFDILKIRPSVSEELNNFINRKVYIIFTDNDGNIYITPKLKLSKKKSIKKTVRSGSYYSFTASGENVNTIIGLHY